MSREPAFPLDLQAIGYAYLERPNVELLDLVRRHLGERSPRPRIVDLGCGAGANARRLLDALPDACVLGVEPNPEAAALAREVMTDVFEGTAEEWVGSTPTGHYDGVLLSDVLEHVTDPVGLVQRLRAAPCLEGALFFISVPNYAVWYNRARTLLGRFEYAFSGLYDRTHLRFFTRASLRHALTHAGLSVLEETCTPSLVQSTAGLWRRLYADDVAAGRHLALEDSAAYGAYERFVAPLEARLCVLWPELLGFQIVVVARAT